MDEWTKYFTVRLESWQRDSFILRYRALGWPCDANFWEAVVKTDTFRTSWRCPEMLRHLHICSRHWSNLQWTIQCAGSCIGQTSSSSLLRVLLTYFHLQGWGFVIDGHGFPLSGIRVRLWGRGRSWVLGVDRKVRRCRNGWIINARFM